MLDLLVEAVHALLTQFQEDVHMPVQKEIKQQLKLS